MSFVTREDHGHVAVVTLSRPEALNAISGEVADQLAGAFVSAAADPGAWVVVLAAAGEKAFCVGADLKERNQLDDRGWMRNRVLMRGLFEAIRSAPQPTVASVFGYALGGGFELALSCDLIVASDDAILGLPEVRVGIVPGGGGTQLLARRVGPSRAKEMIFTGKRIHAGQAYDAGLVARVVPRPQLGAATLELAEEICRSSPVAVREAKKAIDRGGEIPLEHGIEIEDQAWRKAVASEDRAEGIAAFNEKREPRWKGR
ncbi:MAG: enoyl-CoA hydratase-related protein [Actinomycetota bacterium]|nr:enoyl-CoA hydratase-related protein [Actinomycetota bacterium]